MMYDKIIFLGFLVQVYAVIPSGFPQCYRKYPEVNKCLLEATDHPKVRASLLVGIPELALPKISPFNIRELSLEEGRSSFSFKADLKQILLYGFETYNFSKFDFDIPNLKFYCTLDAGPLHLTADYDLKGKLLLAPIDGKGKFVSNITKMHVDIIQEVKIVKKKDVDHLAVVGTKTKLKMDGLTFSFKGLLGGNDVIEQALQSGLDNSRDELIREFAPILEETFSSIIDHMFGDFFNANSYDTLYPLKE